MEVVIDAETHDPSISIGRGAGWVYQDFEILGFAVKINKDPSRFITNINDIKDIVKHADKIICHNAQYDIGCLHRIGAPYQNKTIIDTMILMKLYDNTSRRYTLDEVASNTTGDRKDLTKLTESARLVGIRYPLSHMKEMFEKIPDVVIDYANKDADVTRNVYDWLMAELYPKAFDLIPLYSDLIKALVKWRAKGVRINLVQAEKSDTALQALYDNEMETFYQFCPEVNIESSAQLSESFRQLGLEPDKTLLGNDSVDSAWRAKQTHPAITALSLAKKYQKLRRDFVEGMVSRSENGRIYPEINILGAAETGRFSSSNPNIQQCYDKYTEVLTERGFLFFDQLRMTDKVASWNEGEIQFVGYSNPVTYISEYINKIKSPSGRINLAVTDDHRCLRMRKDGKLDIYFPRELATEWLHLNGGIYSERPFKIFDDFKALVMAINSMGQITSRKGVVFYLSNFEQIQRLTATCRNLNIFFDEVVKLGCGAVKITIGPKRIPPGVWRYIDPETKEFTQKALLFAKEGILEHIRIWYKHQDLKDVIYIRNKQTADMIQAFISMSNASCRIKKEYDEDGTNIYRMHLSDLFYSAMDKATHERVPYNDRVFCITVPSSFLLVRRRGATAICGNCPARDEISNKLVRTLFLPEEGEQWHSLDFSSQEPRVQLAYAYKAGCPGASDLRKEFFYNPKHDLHQQVAAICKISRKQAKTINLAISYGMSKKSVSDALGITKEATYKIFRQYNNLIPYLSRLNKLVKESALRRGFVNTLLGRRLLIDMKAPYKALNKIIQGGSSDMMAICLQKAYQEDLPVMFSVHDSIELSSSNIEHAIRMKEIMEKSFEDTLPIPFHTDIKSGPTWGDVK